MVLDFSKLDETIKKQEHYQQKLIDAFNLAQASGLTWRQLLCSSGVLKNKFVNGYVDSLKDHDQQIGYITFLSETVTADNLKVFLTRLNSKFLENIISPENIRRAEILKLIDAYHQKKGFFRGVAGRFHCCLFGAAGRSQAIASIESKLSKFDSIENIRQQANQELTRRAGVRSRHYFWSCFIGRSLSNGMTETTLNKIVNL